MDNPFLKRATEQFRRDPEAFLGIVSPEPVTFFLGAYAQDDTLYDRLVIIQGTPGSGKTTIAQLFEYPTIAAMLRNPSNFRDLLSAMVKCQAVTAREPRVIGCRLSLETDYRDFWEFSYPPEVKRGLMAALIQARAVQAWLNNLALAGVRKERIEIVPREGSLAAVGTIGGTNVADVEARAQNVEQLLYRIIAALVPPAIATLDQSITEAYRPFDVIERLRILPNPEIEGEKAVDLTPMVILDDAHFLHPEQFEKLRHWLARRELRVARWVMTRLDILQPEKALAVVTEDRTERAALPGITKERDIIEIVLQGGADGAQRSKQRNSFRRMARDMANRYLRQMVVFRDRNYSSLADLLNTVPSSLSPAAFKKLSSHARSTQKKLAISDAVRDQLLESVDAYKPEKQPLTEDVRQQLLIILLNRYARRRVGIQTHLFDSEQLVTSAELEKPIRSFRVDADVYEAACLALSAVYNRPHYFGIDDLCDASSENAEQFLHLAAKLVETMAVQLIRGKGASLDVTTQDKLLTNRAEEIMRDWDFPKNRQVCRLIDFVAALCQEQTLSENAWNSPGPNAYGILQKEFDTVAEIHPELASVMQYGIAYNAFRLIPRYSCKNKEWCLIELGGLAILKHRLTLRRGSFVEGSVTALATGLTGESGR